ncbi:MAG: SsrA-binding protein [Deltaproteobacteria bacterium CG12_big_fil_rev_8_21_14_0_65_43_10]|nr:MAG: SsrA-binding protein [Deltaproteobacteria bacterium CG12_big_fil_rev_8_21_14_0_65_43_10]PIZ19444.1 MAG: SsrA-binding protein [Deltaproteobacteria bacterium CG_4_10_14_0_8_um_filter_43_12]PJB45850.1 MAG: SsrA-binding protein [Deltaproteobacteria bacterium CG_4_9_14_3_um_filter_44_9]
MATKKSFSEKIICKNRKAWHDYSIDEKCEAGIVLKGSEIKSCRMGKVNLKDSYAKIKDGGLYLINTHISPYDHANQFNHDPLRERKLLLHKGEIKRLIGKINERGMTLIPLSMYLKNGKAKVELGLARGKKLYDKRESIKKKTEERDLERSLRLK